MVMLILLIIRYVTLTIKLYFGNKTFLDFEIEYLGYTYEMHISWTYYRLLLILLFFVRQLMLQKKNKYHKNKRGLWKKYSEPETFVYIVQM